MLACNYKTAKQLHIKATEHKALVAVLGMLERGEMTHVDVSDPLNLFRVMPDYPFNMAAFCGTACCIGGWCDILYGTQFQRDSDHMGSNIVDLLYVSNGKIAVGTSLEDVTPAQAALALRNYLTTGKPQWAEVLGVD